MSNKIYLVIAPRGVGRDEQNHIIETSNKITVEYLRAKQIKQKYGHMLKEIVIVRGRLIKLVDHDINLDIL